MKRPGSLTAALLIAIIAPVLAIVLLAVNFLTTLGWLNSIIDGSINKTNGESSTDGIRTAAEGAVVVGTGGFIALLVLFLICTVLWVVCGIKMHRGSSGARAFLTVLGILWLVSGVLGLIGAALGMGALRSYIEQSYDMGIPTSFDLWGYAQAGVAVLAMTVFLILAYLPASTNYLRAARR
ncbi:hypothetical protein GCM10011581_41580 [Saccharopolyspora subtropica]|uniref:Uncharacterized protein n=2 Tax=Saccharopolyspora thermophila TaxID=89367 RepID=A0A917K5S7_9PSEU|nr:hypothetical protein GCM10011581_41580 [Saccharopolyspora subtropica]